MTEEQKDTVVEAPETSGVNVSGHAETAPSPSQDGNQAVQAEPSEEIKEETSTYQPRYLGKKYNDISEFEKAHENALRLANEQGQEKNALAQKVEALETAMKQYGLSQEAPEVSNQPSPIDIETQIEQRLAPVKRQMALREEADAVQEIIRLKPHLAPVANRLIQAWRQSGNENLGTIVNDFEKVFNSGRNTSKEDQLAKQDQLVETGKGAGEVRIAQSAEDRKKAARGGTDSLAAILPDDLGIS